MENIYYIVSIKGKSYSIFIAPDKGFVGVVAGRAGMGIGKSNAHFCLNSLVSGYFRHGSMSWDRYAEKLFNDLTVIPLSQSPLAKALYDMDNPSRAIIEDYTDDLPLMQKDFFSSSCMYHIFDQDLIAVYLHGPYRFKHGVGRVILFANGLMAVAPWMTSDDRRHFTEWGGLSQEFASIVFHRLKGWGI
jgi:hypothetical protein